MENIKSIVGSLGAFSDMREVVKNANGGPSIGGPQFTVAYSGTDFENNYGERPNYDNSTFVVRIKYLDANMRGLHETIIKSIHLVKQAMTIDALNVGDLTTSKLVRRVSVGKATMTSEPPSVIVSIEVTVRYREG